MSHRESLPSSLGGRVVALPESRQLDILADLFERRGAKVLRVPLVSIHDTPDQPAVTAWLRRFIETPPDLFIILTGEGLRRLAAAARRNELLTPFTETLAQVSKLCRGPKPGRALKELQLAPGKQAVTPTTAGIIESLKSVDLAGKRVAVQLYGEDPNPQLMDFLAARELTSCDVVAPYVYNSLSDADRVVGLIERLAGGAIDMIAFTSKPQIKRLFQVARQAGLEEQLHEGLQDTLIAAVGPVVADELARHDCAVQVMPESAYFMKPLVRAAEAAFNTPS